MPRRRAARLAIAVPAALLVVLGGGTCALPRPGLPRTASVGEGAASVITPASVRYRASGIRRFFLGDGYRDLWAAPVRVEVLNLERFAGGLTPLRRGGGRQTRSLRLRGADGREYVFRSVDKDQAKGLHPLVRGSIGRFRQDQVSALHPAAALVAAGLEEATGVPGPGARLVIMPDDPRLGAHRAEFAGLLGTLQPHPDDGFAGAERVAGTASLLEELGEGAGERVDARAFLAARLLDVYLGDWDRHDDQWRWARRERGGAGEWMPIPRDRDYALSDYRGLLPGLARRVDPKIVRFDSAYRDLEGLLVKARPLDARFLCSLPAATWDSAAAALRGALTDSAIAAAVGRMPREYAARSGGLAAVLHARRDRLPDAARRFRADLHEDGGCVGG